MDNNMKNNDENVSFGKKRQQQESPFSAATPKSRINREPKRLFGLSNAADNNLEQTCIESDTSSCSFAPSEASEATPEQTMLTESEPAEGEDDADVTLADTFEEKMAVSTPTAPTSVLSQIQKAVATEDCFSPNVSPPQVNYSLHEFCLLEKESHHEALVGSLNAEIEQLKLKIAEINEARKFEEQALMQQTEAVSKKAKAEKAAANDNIARLTAQLEEQDALKEQLAQLSAHIDELTAKAMNVEDAHDSGYQQRIQQLETEVESLKASENDSRVAELTEELEIVRKMMVSEVTDLEKQLEAARASGSGEELEKSLQEALSQVQKLEAELADVRSSQTANIRQQMESLRQELVKTHSEELAVKVEEMNSKIRGLEAEIEAAREQGSSEILHLQVEHSDEMEQIRTQHAAEIASLQEQLGESIDLQQQFEKARLEFETSAVEAQKQIKELEEQIIAARQGSSDADELQSQIIQLQQQLAVQSDEKNLVSEQLEGLQKQITELETKASEEKSSFEQNLDEVREQHGLQIVQLQEQLSVETNEKDSLAKQLEELQKQLVNIEAKLSEEKVFAEELLDKTREEHRTELGTAQKKIQELEEQIITARQGSSDAGEQTLQIVQLQEQLVAKSDENDSISKQLDELQKQLVDLERKASGEKSLFEQNFDETREQHRLQLEEAALKAQIQIQELEEQIVAARQLSSNADEHQLQIVQLQKQLVDLETKTSEEKVSVEELFEKTREQHRVELEEAAATAQKQIQALEEELIVARQQGSLDADEQRLQIVQLNEQLSARTEEVQSITQKLEDLHQQIAEVAVKTAEEKSSFEETIEKLGESASVAQKQVERLEGELAVQSDEKNTLINQLEDLQNQKVTLESELVALRVKQAEELVNSEKSGQLEEQLSEERQKTANVVAELENVREKHRAEMDELADNFRKQSQGLEEQLTAVQQQLVTARQEQTGLEGLGEQLASALEDNSKLKEELDQAVQQKTDAAAEFEHQKLSLVSEMESLQAKQSEELAQLHKELADGRTDEQALETLNARIVELETSIAYSQKEVAEMEKVHQQKEQQLADLQSEVAISKLQHDETMRVVADLKEKLEAAEQAMSEKENLVVRLESRLEVLTGQLEESSCWKAQAMSVETLTKSLTSMQTQLAALSAQLEASNRRVVEVEEIAQHDVTLMKEEVDERSAELDKARALIAELEEKLQRANAKIDRLEKMCDEFDDIEFKLKEKVRNLEEEVKTLKGVKPPVPVMGLLQQARLGIKPLSRESSMAEQPEKETYEDASDSFVVTSQKTMNMTAKLADSPNVTTAVASTTIHPDDSAANMSALGTPSSKKNKSNCQQQ